MSEIDFLFPLSSVFFLLLSAMRIVLSLHTRFILYENHYSIAPAKMCAKLNQNHDRIAIVTEEETIVHSMHTHITNTRTKLHNLSN